MGRRPQDHCKAGVSCFLHHMLILSTELCRCICFAYSVSRMVWTTNMRDFLLLYLVKAHIARDFGLQ